MAIWTTCASADTILRLYSNSTPPLLGIAFMGKPSASLERTNLRYQSNQRLLRSRSFGVMSAVPLLARCINAPPLCLDFRLVRRARTRDRRRRADARAHRNLEARYQPLAERSAWLHPGSYVPPVPASFLAVMTRTAATRYVPGRRSGNVARPAAFVTPVNEPEEPLRTTVTAAAGTAPSDQPSAVATGSDSDARTSTWRTAR
jgi:hypothetical protein